MTSKRLLWIGNLFCIKKTVVFYDSWSCSGVGYSNRANKDNSVEKPFFKVDRTKKCYFLNHRMLNKVS